ncbi:MAG: ATP-binding protein, partial [bacterium]
MTKDYSPFTPGIPVPFEFFMGRLAELQALTGKGKAALSGRIERVFVSGPRGIGKSSFCRVARQILAKEGVLGIHVFLGGAHTLEEMVRRTFDALLAETREISWFGKIKALFGRHIEEADILGLTIRFRADQQELNQLASSFAPALRKILQEVGNEAKGLFLILDDLNGLAPEAAFANWLKSLVDSIATSDHPLPLLLALVGLPERRSQLIQNQPSLDRVFDLIDILPLNEAETQQFYERAFASVGLQVQPDAHSILYQFSGGFPVLMHEIGDATFKIDDDQKISGNDAMSGVAQAAEIVGRKYLEAQVFDAIRSQRYRSILRHLARQSDSTGFKRQDIVQNLRGDEVKVLDNFLH